MGRIEETFVRLRAARERALVPFITGGDPDLDTTEALVLAMAESGADLIEIGVPFSDPTAEGPTIQRSSERALAGGTTLRRILERVRDLRPRVDLPLLLMGYANPFYAMGEEGFVQAAAEVGVDGIIVADLPPEEGEAFYHAAELHGIDPVLLAAPTTVESRLKLLAGRTRGFLYYVSLTGVTGARAELARDLEADVGRVRKHSEIPVCVGFGISTPEHARLVGSFADGVVVGSAIVDRIEAAASKEAAVDTVAQFISALKAPLRAASPLADRSSEPQRIPGKA
jgi:tryptophan synthase alpha chain